MNSPAIRFNGQVEYTLDGDFAKLGAHLGIDAPEQIANETLSLQLWACDDHFDPSAPQNTRIASLPLHPVHYSGFYSDQTPALPPAGNRDYLIAMALVGETAEGITHIHDLALFNNRQLFTQPRLQGHVDCQLFESRVELNVESIINPRDELNLSGSLSLELWALNTPYNGGAFAGIQLASYELGALQGGSEWRDSRFTLDKAQPPAGEWSVVLMLREWTSAGYVTRDYRQLPDLIQAPLAPAHALEQESPAHAEAGLVDPAELEAAKVSPVREEAEEPKPKARKADTKKSSEPSVKKSAAKAKPTAKQVRKSKAVKEAKAEAPVSINSADMDALAAVRGLSPRLAKAIIAERPYDSLDQLTRARGLGDKTVAKIKKYLSL